MERATLDDRSNYRDPACPQRQVLDLIADKWSVLALHLLARGTTRYNRLLRDIGGISPKMLTQTLRGLERDGLVTRRVYPVAPPKVEYALTPLGESLREATAVVLAWGEARMPEVAAARLRYAEDADAEPRAAALGSASDAG
jgi:DNA-binding HxlR family transcriptional regulator